MPVPEKLRRFPPLSTAPWTFSRASPLEMKPHELDCPAATFVSSSKRLLPAPSSALTLSSSVIEFPVTEYPLPEKSTRANFDPAGRLLTFDFCAAASGNSSVAEPSAGGATSVDQLAGVDQFAFA